MTRIITPTGWKEIEEEYGTFHENIDEAYHPEPPKRYDFPIEVESLVKERAKKHIDSLNSDPNSEHYYTHRFHYKGPRTKIPTPIGRGARPASTPKANATGFSIAIYRRSKKHKYPKGYKGGEHVGYVLPGDIGVQPHATKHAELPRRRMWESVYESQTHVQQQRSERAAAVSESTQEQLDELSKDLLARYAYRATMQFGQDAYDAGVTQYDSKRMRLLKRVKRRKDGLKLAISKLARERDPTKKDINESEERAYDDGYKAYNKGLPRSKNPHKGTPLANAWHLGHKEAEYDTNQWLNKWPAPLKESSTTPGYEELEDAVDTMIRDILPDLKRSSGTIKDLHGAAISHLNDRLFDEYPNANKALRNRAVETVVDRYLSKAKFSTRRRHPHDLPVNPKLPKKQKEKEQTWNKAGFKSKSDKPPIAGKSSYGKARYALEENHSPLRKIISLIESRNKLTPEEHLDRLSKSFHDDRTFTGHLDNLHNDKSMSKDHIRKIHEKLGNRHDFIPSSFSGKSATRQELINDISRSRILMRRNMQADNPNVT